MSDAVSEVGGPGPGPGLVDWHTELRHIVSVHECYSSILQSLICWRPFEMGIDDAELAAGAQMEWAVAVALD